MPSQFSIRCRVQGADEQRVSGLTVHAFDRDLRSEQLLGEADVAADGTFSIGYTADRFRRADKATADLLVRVIDVQRSPAEILRLEIDGASADPLRPFFNAPEQCQVIIVASLPEAADVTEYERYAAGVMPLLDGVTPADLTRDNLTFLLGDLGLADPAPRDLEFFRDAAALATQTGVAPEAFYAWARADVPAGWEKLLGADDAQRAVLLSRRLSALQEVPAWPGGPCHASAPSPSPASKFPPLSDAQIKDWARPGPAPAEPELVLPSEEEQGIGKPNSAFRINCVNDCHDPGVAQGGWTGFGPAPVLDEPTFAQKTLIELSCSLPRSGTLAHILFAVDAAEKGKTGKALWSLAGAALTLAPVAPLGKMAAPFGSRDKTPSTGRPSQFPTWIVDNGWRSDRSHRRSADNRRGGITHRGGRDPSGPHGSPATRCVVGPASADGQNKGHRGV